MSLPARKQPGASRRRKKQTRLRQFKQRLLGTPKPIQWDTTLLGKPVLHDVLKMIELLEKDKAR